MPDYADDLRLAVRLARQAGATALEQCGKVDRLTKTHAATTDEAVTIADRAAQAVVVEGLRSECPNDGIIGEESETGDSITADNLQPTGRNWVIDPIDGTNNFIAGLGNWAVCIGLLDAGRPVVGVVYDVTRDLLYAGAEGVGATVNDEPTTAPADGWSSASVLMLTSNLLDRQGNAPAWATAFLSQTNWKVRMLGSAAIESVMVGAGIAHGAITVNGKLWDCVAPAAFTLAAGGRVTQLSGEPVFPYDVANYAGAKVPFVTAGPAAVDELVERLRHR
ncbi:MAG: inositol monophosphatase family protein [Planctomycetota bacterium]